MPSARDSQSEVVPPSAASKILQSLRLIVAVLVSTVPPLLLGKILRAEGPLAITTLWSLFLVLATGVASIAGKRRPFSRSVRPVLWISGGIALILGAIGTLIVLVQINVTRRSLAEAWLILARRGDAFGFFSFFATELYALLCLGAALLVLLRGYLPCVCAFAAATFLVVGITLDHNLALAFSLIFAAAVPLSALRSASGSRLQHIRSAFPPTAAAIIFSLLWALVEGSSAERPFLQPIDFTPLIQRLAPAFPLLVDVPGYGYEVGASRLSPHLYLSTGNLFYAQGDGPGVHYLVSTVYESWSGTIWRESSDAGESLPVHLSTANTERDAGAIRLTLAEDFYSRVPVERSTALVLLSSSDAPPIAIAASNTGLRFSESARRGLTADLLQRPYGSPRPESESPDPRWLDAGADPSGRIEALADALILRARDREGNGNRDRAVLAELLDYFKTGFSYSLNIPGGSTQNSLEHFLFETKTGYCLYFASSFALLARRAGIPSRVVEGYRLTLDESGAGLIRGVNAHAWVESWVDGDWRLMEPTPPYASDDPFSYLNRGDAFSRRQLEALFGAVSPPRTADSSHKMTWALLLPSLIALGFFALFVVTLSLTLPRLSRTLQTIGGTRRLARHLVRRARILGIPGPERSGWTGWAQAVESRLASMDAPHHRKAQELTRAGQIAKRMMDLTFKKRSP